MHTIFDVLMSSFPVHGMPLAGALATPQPLHGKPKRLAMMPISKLIMDRLPLRRRVSNRGHQSTRCGPLAQFLRPYQAGRYLAETEHHKPLAESLDLFLIFDMIGAFLP